ncbi:BTB/POZ and MATH domain-containing protein 1 [Sorghum bicolor]|uniref:BTB domain-containing protein n=1 Tax=Sorghum bicolor TaxID=4558 RepID=C5YJ19_SORBI|nr:BTB/POZ and MATH domain-containing protein 1 [Sorghum bicolor]EES14743.1 hypothetical protein SORBI_3007G083400 [Sorghum bicolor]|eukprot:XP_002445248.1 BTB/POZ and MATH domain-containing protein 1 [Sorghum bicolor]
MAASQGPRRKTVSRCIPETDQCTQVFDISGYSLLKGLGAGKFVESAAFVAGGRDWCIRFFPDGHAGEDLKDYVAVYLALVTNSAEARALFEFRLVNPATGGSSSVYTCKTPMSFKAGGNQGAWGCRKLKKRSELEESVYLQNDRLVIQCDVTVIVGPPVITSEADIQVPPSDLTDTLGKYLESGKRSDVTFKVKGEAFHAHKFVLAFRSPVFEAEFYGPMRGKSRRQNITVEDMEPDVFKALLHFIYTDSLPPLDDLDEDESQEMDKHLLVAADRYAMERMKLMCESILTKRIDVHSVATTLALADQHHCEKLKEACIGFISSSDKMDLVASNGYEHLKRACPAIFMDIWENEAKSRRMM